MQNIKYKYRLYPNKEQEQSLLSFCGAQRFVWNYFLNKEQEEYKESGKFLFKHKNITSLPAMKKQEALDWLKTIPSTSLQQTLKHLDRALNDFLKDKKSKKPKRARKEFPVFKKKRFFHGSFTLAMVDSKLISDDQRHFRIPKIGNVRIKLHRELPSNFKTCTVKQEAGKWFVSFTVKKQEKQKVSHIKRVTGLDMNSKAIVCDNSGNEVVNPKFLSKAKKKLKKEQRRLSRKEKGSQNRRKQLLKVSRAFKSVRDKRKDFLDKLSSDIVSNHDLICLEDLNVAGMSRFNGSMVADIGWSELRSMIEYKADLEGKHVSVIDRWFPSSQMCSDCGSVVKKSLSERVHSCDCGLSISRDQNAAINILNEGLKQFQNSAGTARINACGEPASGDIDLSISSYGSLKQEARVPFRGRVVHTALFLLPF